MLQKNVSVESGLLPLSKSYARKHNADLAIPNCAGSGLGNVLVYTRLIDDYAMSLGRPISIITAPISPKVGVVPNESPYPFFENNPFIGKIINADEVDQEGFIGVNSEELSLVQLSHVIENICFAYGIRPRVLRPSLYLTKTEKAWALRALQHLPRPLVCLHPGGTTSSPGNCPWNVQNWLKLTEILQDRASFFQIGRKNSVDQDLGLENPGRTLREAIALIWASDFYIGFDSCPMHIATALNKDLISIFHMENKYTYEAKYKKVFVPSVMLRWAYPFNTNLAIMPDDYDGEKLLLRIVDKVSSSIKKLKYEI
ncbi:glycosyltransferase family 9 protein [Maridesulfovibrio sp.]|uniref:glycosyltransferase family 9 protein n=1 Tax=Maridesulfovibrio sp. TaxID=2795000 RepID=UPI002A186C9D|nr:glycosyltransferase family 9 protein [Maridesulfovibrio sp.]